MRCHESVISLLISRVAKRQEKWAHKPFITTVDTQCYFTWRNKPGTTIQKTIFTWWRHQMEIFSALLALCAGNSPVPVNSPHKGQWRGALVLSLSKQPWSWWFETPSWSLWRQCNDTSTHSLCSRPCHDVTVDCVKNYGVWQLWRGHGEVIFHLLDINFIHCDICNLSCEIFSHPSVTIRTI